jgi:hypothetical protein
MVSESAQLCVHVLAMLRAHSVVFAPLIGRAGSSPRPSVRLSAAISCDSRVISSCCEDCAGMTCDAALGIVWARCDAHAAIVTDASAPITSNLTA